MEKVRKLFHNSIISLILKNADYFLRKELKDCGSVLDLGCGNNSPLRYCSGLSMHKVGIEIFEPNIEESKYNNIHDKYICDDILKIDFHDNCFDAVILIQVIEHLNKKEGEIILDRMERWAKKKILIASPNGYIPQDSFYNNPHDIHYSGWDIKEMRDRGYKAYGQGGLRFLRKGDDKHGHGIYSTFRFWPKRLFVVITGLTQLFTYYFPQFAFEVFYVKDIKKEL